MVRSLADGHSDPSPQVVCPFAQPHSANHKIVISRFSHLEEWQTVTMDIAISGWAPNGLRWTKTTENNHYRVGLSL